MLITEAFGKRTQELLYKHNMSPYRLMRLSGLTLNTVVDLTKSRKPDAKLSTVHAIISTLGVSWKEFVDSPLFDPENLD